MRRLVIVLFFVFFPVVSSAAPNVTGATVGSTSITVTGSGFGSTGPTIRVYDEFTGTPGQEIPLTSANVGSWSSYGNSNRPKYIADDTGTNTAALMIDGNVGTRTLIKDFADTQEFFISYKVRTPSGYWFPNASGPGVFNEDVSVWKYAWLWDYPAAANANDDVCIPTRIDGNNWTIAGNDNGIQPVVTMGRDDNSTLWYSFTGWNRVTAWLKGGLPDPLVNPGIVWAQGLSEEHGNKVFGSTSSVIFDGHDEGTWDDEDFEWNRLNIPGYINVGSAGDNVRATYDDIYIASGDNAAARVEIGNNATYSSCTKLAIQTPTSWADGSVTVDLRKGEFVDGESVYVFVIDKDNVPSTGYRVTLAGGSGGGTTGPSLKRVGGGVWRLNNGSVLKTP